VNYKPSLWPLSSSREDGSKPARRHGEWAVVLLKLRAESDPSQNSGASTYRPQGAPSYVPARGPPPAHGGPPHSHGAPQYQRAAPGPSRDPFAPSAPHGGSAGAAASFGGRSDAASRGVSSDSPQGNPPSRVLHLRQVPLGATPHDIAEFMSQFGRVDYATLLPTKGQALVEFAEVPVAARVIETGQRQPLVLGGRTIFCNFSRSHQINRAVATRMPAQMGGSAVAVPFDASGGRSTVAPRPDVMDDRPLPTRNMFVTPVVCFHINKATAPIDVDTIARVCESVGAEFRPLRIVIFYKNGVQALVELDSVDSAYRLAEVVHNQFIYEDCCKIVAAPSRTASTLNVKVQNDTTRDFTRNDLPSGPSMNPHSLTPVQMAERELAIESGRPVPPLPWDDGGGDPRGRSGSVGHSGPSHSRGGVSPSPSGHSGGPHGIGSAATGPAVYVPVATAPGSIVAVYGLDPARATAKRVFNLFCVYGNVRRVRCAPPGSDPADEGLASAVVEMEDATQAAGATGFLNGQTLFGNKLRIVSTPLLAIEGRPLPSEAADPLGAMHVRDYVGSPVNRFRKAEQFRNVFEPGPTLHVANVPASYTEADIERYIMENGGARPSAVSWMDMGGGRVTVGAPRRIGLVQFSSTSEALESLMMANNTFADGHTIKLATTNKTINHHHR
jgi:heterogeneous nuclear ribonucleoprotein L